ncbi:DUF3850 domain-containing protein [Niabella sp. CC-SYL272]|uniref:ASCH/PUA domain-containing protein n=1 Tax=Niabella agricola TaxID=2891571 RepID=UPI001F1D781A|nr:ASCH/PUA domain-containing protein [Niabella agricola]MCF3107296.1 DUF3850 domain-containing protein [Niabella agricola]
MVHELKTHPKYFSALLAGSKTFEVRKNDRDYKIGDELLLKEYDPDDDEIVPEPYTGRILHRRIDYILHGGQYGIEPGYCVMSISKI